MSNCFQRNTYPRLFQRQQMKSMSNWPIPPISRTNTWTCNLFRCSTMSTFRISNLSNTRGTITACPQRKDPMECLMTLSEFISWAQRTTRTILLINIRIVNQAIKIKYLSRRRIIHLQVYNQTKWRMRWNRRSLWSKVGKRYLWSAVNPDPIKLVQPPTSHRRSQKLPLQILPSN